MTWLAEPALVGSLAVNWKVPRNRFVAVLFSVKVSEPWVEMNPEEADPLIRV